MLTCCNNSKFQQIQFRANRRKYHPKLFNLFNIDNSNINSIFKPKGKLDLCLELISVMWKWNPGIISLFFLEDIHITCTYTAQFWLIFPNRNYKSRLIEYNLNWCCHHTLHLKKITLPIFEYLLKTPGTTTKVLSCLKISLTGMRVLRTSSPRSRPRLVSYPFEKALL